MISFPILLLRKTNKHIYIQLISYDRLFVIYSISSVDRSLKNYLSGLNFKLNGFQVSVIVAYVLVSKLNFIGISILYMNYFKYVFSGKLRLIYNILRVSFFIL